jgi:hypothetical protein
MGMRGGVLRGAARRSVEEQRSGPRTYPQAVPRPLRLLCVVRQGQAFALQPPALCPGALS